MAAAAPEPRPARPRRERGLGASPVALDAESFVTHKPTAIFCYVFGPHRDGTPVGAGTQYRLTVQGPGALPDVTKYVAPPGPWDRTQDQQANAEQLRAFSDNLCRPN